MGYRIILKKDLLEPYWEGRDRKVNQQLVGLGTPAGRGRSLSGLGRVRR